MKNEIVTHFIEGLTIYADSTKATEMENYMKNIQPFLGVQRPMRDKVYKTFKKNYGTYWRKEMNNEEFLSIITKIWNGRYREYRYAALFLIEYSDKFISWKNLDYFKNIIIEGGWWDTTDSTAQKVIGHILAEHKEKMTPIIKSWTQHEDLWIRRTTILSQLKFKDTTDTDLLEYILLQLIDEDEFFIQKAIGWALREYSKTNSDWVLAFTKKNKSNLSKLAYREGTKYLD